MEHKVEEVKLKCGAKGLLIDVPDATVFCMEIYFRAGDAYTKSHKKMETAHIMEHVAFAANRDQASSAEVARVISRYGARYNAFTTNKYLGYQITCPDFDSERLLNHLVMQVSTPRFLKKEFESEFGNVEEEMQLRSNDRWGELTDVMNQRFGFKLCDTNMQRLELMRNVKHEDLKEHYLRTHSAKNAVFFIAGSVKGKRAKMIEILEQLSALPDGDKLKLPELAMAEGFHDKPVVITKDDVPNIYVSMEMFGISKLDEERATANLVTFNEVVGDNDHSRIYGKAREMGIAYHIGFNKTTRDDGLYSVEVYFQVSKDNIDKLLDLIVTEYKKIVKDGFSKEEVEEALMSIKGGMRMDNETVSQISYWHSGWYISSEEERIHLYDEVTSQYDKVNAESIQELFLNLIKTKKWGAGFLGNVTDAQAKKWNKKLAEIFED